MCVVSSIPHLWKILTRWSLQEAIRIAEEVEKGLGPCSVPSDELEDHALIIPEGMPIKFLTESILTHSIQIVILSMSRPSQI